MMNVLRYTEVQQVNIEQLKLLIELLTEMTQCGGVASQALSEAKVVK